MSVIVCSKIYWMVYVLHDDKKVSHNRFLYPIYMYKYIYIQTYIYIFKHTHTKTSYAPAHTSAVQRQKMTDDIVQIK